MAHFVELNSANEVLRVIVINNHEIVDDNGVEQESIGVQLCNNLLGGTWKQTSYNSRIRGNYAFEGFTYFVDQDLFMPPKPYNSWLMNTADATWQAPSPMPTDGQSFSPSRIYDWDEDNQTWINVSGASAGG
tara:strand:+ start:290 stop:685 length:396 start_codon:yes stop_codon:yes gene_type:complete